MRKLSFLIPIVGLVVISGIWVILKHVQEPLVEREFDIVQYVKQHDGIDAVVGGSTEFANGGTAWALQPKADKTFGFTVVDMDSLRHTLSAMIIEYHLPVHKVGVLVSTGA
jgi:hypothetical protein